MSDGIQRRKPTNVTWQHYRMPSVSRTRLLRRVMAQKFTPSSVTMTANTFATRYVGVVYVYFFCSTCLFIFISIALSEYCAVIIAGVIRQDKYRINSLCKSHEAYLWFLAWVLVCIAAVYMQIACVVFGDVVIVFCCIGVMLQTDPTVPDPNCPSQVGLVTYTGFCREKRMLNGDLKKICTWFIVSEPDDIITSLRA
jgi:hypothetical protein